MTYLDEVSSFLVTQTYETIDEAVLHLGKRAILDYLGCAIAGTHQDVAENVRKYCASQNRTGKATALGMQSPCYPDDAAFINAVSGHSLDFDDTSWTTIGHPTTVAVPVALAEAENLGLGGKEVLAGFCLGVEVAHALAKVSMPEVSERGWHTTCVYGVIMATAVSCWMRKCDQKTTRNALGLALSRAAGIRCNFGTMTKPLHGGLASKMGMECASLAQAGITSSANAFEGDDGFLDCFGGKKDNTPLHLGKPWDFVENGLAFKLFPCCSGAHPTLDIVTELLQEGLDATKIASIHAGVSLLGPRELVNHRPQTALEARFSLEYTVSALLLRGKLTLDEMTQECVSSPDIQAFMEKITMEVDDELAKLGFIGTAPVKLTITMQDGTQIFRANDLARGNPEKPLADEDFIAKFSKNSLPTLSQEAVTLLIEKIFALEKETNITQLITLAICK